MMNTLHHILQQSESETVEFKQSTGEIREIVETVCAFANTRGGTILIGVSNAGDVLGVTIGKDTREQLINHITQNTDPIIYPTVEIARQLRKPLLVISVDPNDNKPHLAYGHGFVRVGPTTRRMSRDHYERLLRERSDASFDRLINRAATFNDLDRTKLQWFRHTVEAVTGQQVMLKDDDLLRNVGCLKDGHVTNAGVLLFGKQPAQFLPHSSVTIVRYPGTEISDRYLDVKDIQGTLFDLIDRSDAYLREHTQVASRLVPGQVAREDLPQYPFYALRELVVNAVAHRDYFIQGSRIILRVFHDRIEFTSPGGFPPGITPQNIAKRQYSRNPVLVHVLHQARYIEAIGDGINRVLATVAHHPLKPKKPTFCDIDGMVEVTLYAADLSRLRPEERSAILNARQQQALMYLQEHGSMTNAVYRRLVNVSNVTAASDLRNMVDKGFIRAEGKGRAHRYVLGEANR